MYGAIIGDVVGSVYEFHNILTKDFPLFSPRCVPTDDSVMTVAVAKALLRYLLQKEDLKCALVEEMQRFGRRYPTAGYGGRFAGWLLSSAPKPYYSFGNGSAMRVSPCGLIARSMEEALRLAKCSAEVTHDHPEGIRGAQSVAAAIYLARCGSTKEEIRAHIEQHYYQMPGTLEEIRRNYGFDETCQGSVPQAFEAFFESESYEDCIRNAISIGGDSDTIAAIAGSVAWSYYGRNGLQPDMKNALEQLRLNRDLLEVIRAFDAYRAQNGLLPAWAQEEENRI